MSAVGTPKGGIALECVTGFMFQNIVFIFCDRWYFFAFLNCFYNVRKITFRYGYCVLIDFTRKVFYILVCCYTTNCFSASTSPSRLRFKSRGVNSLFNGIFHYESYYLNIFGLSNSMTPRYGLSLNFSNLWPSVESID